MSSFKSLRLSKIHVPATRSRKVDEDHALAIQASIMEQGQITPILVRNTPNGKRPYELVAGAHRYRAIELLGEEDQIDCLVVSADKEEAAILEVSENIFRNELTALDRAVAVQIYRDAWEKKHGKINPKGGRPKNSVNITELVSDEAQSGFSKACAEKLGLSKNAIEKANQIAKNLPKKLRDRLAGTPVADNQSMLLRFARLEPVELKVADQAIEKMNGDIGAALDVLEDKPVVKQTRDEEMLGKLIDTWSRTNQKVRDEFMEFAELTPIPNPKD